jgi:type VI secretion system protein ImpK
MTDPFASLISPVFQQVIDLQARLEAGESPRWEAERGQLLAALEEADRKASISTRLAHDFELARYALVYWIDEILINSPWAHALEWRQHILEWEIYQERYRADKFFEKAAEAEALAETDPLETFYLCVALGFRGKHRDSPTELRRWGERVYNRIVAGGAQTDKFLPEEAAERQPLRPLPGKAILLAVSVLVSITALFTLACFVFAVPPWD